MNGTVCNKIIKKNLYLKFTVDRCVSCLLLVLVSPLIVFIAFCMWIEGLFFKDSRGPIFYREKRISQGKPFTLYKFRVLTASALQKAAMEDSVWFLQFEKQNTTVMGKILIRCYLDEMPQLLNIFLGQMSFVGPRPRVPPIYEKDVAGGYSALKYLKGGITGLSQLAKGIVKDGLPFSEEYLRICNSYGPMKLLKYDLGIMWKSVFKLMKAEGL
jgi:lipopolysaccharide/colanic/teichoic acid biosynthesis glycosyltransferase